MEAQQFKQTILSTIDDLDLTNELITRISRNQICIDHICNIAQTSRIEYLEACLEGMDTDQLKAFERTFYKIYVKQKEREEEDSRDHRENIDHLNRTFRI
jgi:hypothetical protein